MKLHSFLLAACLGFTTICAHAAALPKNLVAADAKWLLHLDLQNLRITQVGDFLIKNVLTPATSGLNAKVGIDVSALLQKISHVTAYGTDFAQTGEATLLVQMDADTRKILEGFLAAHLLADTTGAFKKEQQGTSVLYSMQNEMFLDIEPSHIVIVGKSAKQIEKAKTVLNGQTPSLKSIDAFSDFAPVPDAFFFLAAAEGFNQQNGMPPQAQILQKAEGGRVVVGERSGKLFLDVALKTKSPEVTEQIQQVIEGIQAMFSLSQSGNRDLQDLVKSIKVSAKNKLVSVNAEFPVAPLVKTVAEQLRQNPDLFKPDALEVKPTPKPEPAKP